uniref:CCHC-type domain-containing protein n=1 Tax=Tanacetum cinerariifolium TaxID=118510 RepID=A0A699KNI8_TANCI|nr:hypothetical protein [Tanacetum cinerariifolium]
MKNKLSAHQDTISILKQQKDAQIKLYKSREDKEIEKVIDLENKVKVLDNIVDKTGQSVQTMNMLNNKCQTSFEKPEFLKKAKQANPRLYDIEWQRFVTLVKQSQELKHVSYHKLYDILKQHQHEVNEILAEKIARHSSIRTHQAATRKREKAIVHSPQPIYDQEPSMVDDDEDTSKDKEIDKLMALISLSFKKIYKPTNNNLRTSSTTSRAHQDNSPQIHKNTGYKSQRSGNVAGARETVGSSMVQKSRIQCYNCKEYRHVARECKKPKRAKDTAYHREKMLLYAVDSRPIFDTEPEQKIDQNEEDADLAKERELLASLIAKLKCEIDESKNRNTLLETSNKVLVEKLKSEIADFRNKNKSLTEANNKLSETTDLMYADFKKSKGELKQRDSIEYATEMELECAKVKEMKNKLSAHQDTISILKQQKDAQIKLYKSREDKEIEKVIDLENKVKVLDNIVYKTGQSV